MALLVSSAAHAAGRLQGRSRRAVYAVGALVLAALAAKTWSQTEVYRSGSSFFQHIVSLNPSARDAHLNLADAMVADGRFDESVATARIAVEQRPDHASAHHVLGRALAGLKRFEEAEDAFSKALELAPRDASIAHNHGQMYREAGRHEDAVEKFREALEIKPDLAVAHGAMGVALSALGRYEESLESTTKAMSQWPWLRQVAVLQNAAGYAAWKLKDLAKAAGHFQTGLGVEPNNAGIHLNIGRVRLEQKRVEEAGEHLRRVLALRPGDSTALLEVGDAFRLSGYAEQSLASYRQVPEGSSARAQALAGMGLALFDMGRYSESIEASEEALELDPELPLKGEAIRYLGSAHAELGNFEQAVEHLRRAVESDPEDADSVDRLGLLFFEHGRFHDALDQYLLMKRLRPDSAQTHVNIGSSLVKLGRDEDAIPVFEKARDLDPDYEGLETTLQILRRAVGIE
jgi:tetratricopeptide (TPR) repeat protein